ncbi:MAG TPA: ankyrin repeat domain-containing protein [Terracidiphilus sp.]|nr:ankyrin repeat domain-containing protein [Terracidiphilus sp.]
MPAKQFPSEPDLNHLKYQAKDLLKGHAAHDLGVAQRIREFNPRFRQTTDAEIFAAVLQLSDAQFTIAREYGFKSWARLKAHVESPELAAKLKLRHHERIEDAEFRRAVDLLDAGDTAGLREHLKRHPKLVLQHVEFESGNYFHSAALLEFIAENPIRHGTLPKNIVEVAQVILDAGPDQASRDVTLALVATGSVPYECGVQLKLIDLLCDHGADADSAIHAAGLHGYFQTVTALIARGARIDLATAAVLDRVEDARRLLRTASSAERHLALAVASQVGHIEIVRLLLDAGEDPNRYNPLGGHSHTTPLHQAALIGHEELVRLLIERGASVDTKDLLWRGTPADWARHEGRTEVESYLRARETRREPS